MEATPRETTEDVTCLACGCLCDDLRIKTENGRLFEADAACEIGRKWFSESFETDRGPVATIEGSPVNSKNAIERAAAIFGEARYPVVFGMTMTVTESVREAIHFARRIGARVVLNRSAKELRRVSGYQNQGRVSATLGEVKGRADVVVFWRCDPVRTHPRHFERYSVEPRGRFVPGGRKDRFVIVVDAEETQTAEAADLFVPLRIDQDLEALTVLRSLILGRSIGSTFRTERHGLDLEKLKTLAAHLKRARYGAFFHDESESMTGRGGSIFEAGAKLVRELNEFTRFVMLGMGRRGNLAGAEAALTWQTGFLQGAEFRAGTAHPSDSFPTLDELLMSGEPDAILCYSDELPADLSPRALAHLLSIPRVAIGPDVTRPGRLATSVALATTTPGIHSGGTVIRVDGVGIPLRPSAKSRLPEDRDWLRQILEILRANEGLFEI